MKIFKYLKKYWLWAILAPLFMVGEVLMDLLQPTLMSVLVDNGINGAEFADDFNPFLKNLFTSTAIWGNIDSSLVIILNVGLLMILLVFFGGCFGVLSGVFTNKASFHFANDLRRDAFNHIINLSFEQTDSFTTGSLVTRMTNDVTQVQNMVSMSMRMLIRTSMQFIMGVFFLLSIKKEFSSVLLIALPIELALILFFLFKLSPLFSKVQKNVDNVNNVVQENVTGARVVKAYVKEEYEKERFAKANQGLFDINWRLFKIMSFMSPFMSIIMSGCMVFLYYIGGTQIHDNFQQGVLDGLKVGEVMAAANYITIILMGFMMLAMMFQSLVRGYASVKRLNEVLDSDPIVSGGTETEGLEGMEGTVEFRNVSFGYPNTDDTILSNINIKINKGERIGILGATGSGKSSLVNLIPRFYDCSKGEVLVNGKNVKEYDLNVLREKFIAIALQKSELYTGTIKDNICFGKKDASMEEVEHASKIAQAHNFITSFNEGYDTFVAEKGASLSGGQKQRISIARTIIKKPEIIIFDDATSALDLATEAELYKDLNTEMKDTTLIIIAQRVASVKNADKIMIINDGEIAAFDSHENLIKNCDIYIDIYNSQLKKEGGNDGR